MNAIYEETFRIYTPEHKEKLRQRLDEISQSHHPDRTIAFEAYERLLQASHELDRAIYNLKKSNRALSRIEVELSIMEDKIEESKLIG